MTYCLLVCSIIGYRGIRRAAPLLLNGLQRMEYRGYDSAGIATYHEGRIALRKGVGRVAEVNATFRLDSLSGEVGIGHTRWATHGGVTEANAHPHASSSGQIAMVHNGIIDNHTELREMLLGKGYLFRSETDSEVIANLLQLNFDGTHDVMETINRTIAELNGNYAFAAIFPDGTLTAARYHEPLILGIGRDGYYLASDILGFVEQTDRVIYIENREIVTASNKGIYICDFGGSPAKHEVIKISTEVADVEKGDYVHYTLKEIFEQPASIAKSATLNVRELSRAAEIIRQAKTVYLTGSGSSLNAGLVGKYLLSKHAGLSVEPIISSEARFSPARFDSESVVIAISQSGESADVLEAVSRAKESGAKIVSIVNVASSSLARMSSVAVGLGCGPEIGVAATKSFTSQLVIFLRLADELSGGRLNPRFEDVSKVVSDLLMDYSKIRKMAEKIADVRDIYVLGMGAHWPIASEASLKLKELAYVHAEAIPGGELKHGPLALLDSLAHVILLNPSDSTYPNAVASGHEVKARGAKVIGVSDRPSENYDHWIEIPAIDENLFPLVEVIPMQLLSYYLALHKNTNPDFPRNLAKCVTVK
jgi:glutamine---fructose-6-phosphate transaminase (isomerizing)